MPILRPYQGRGSDQIRAAYASGKRAPLAVFPTGSGKTQLFSAITNGAAAKGNRVLILTHRIELIDQISDTLGSWGVTHGFVASGYSERQEQCMIASVQTLVRRLDSIPEPQLIICDEAHHARAKTFESILTHWPRAKLLGVTATPIRNSGEGLGTLFDCLILGPTVAELIAGNYLAQPRVFGPETVDTSGLHIRGGEFVIAEAEELMNKPSITGSALSMYIEKTPGLPALAFCVSVEHAKNVAQQFRGAGYSATSLDSGTEREVRRGIVRDFREKRITVLTSVDIFSEGFDCPGVHVGIMLRPTQSEVIYRQQAGRILRPEIGKDYAYIHDHVRNWERFGLPHWDRETPWSLKGEDKKKKKPSIAVKVCSKCFAAMRSGTRKCPECGDVAPVKNRKIEQREGDLVELTAEEVAKRMQKRRDGFERSKAQTPESLAEVFRKQGMKGDLVGRARHVIAARLAKSRR